MTRKRKKVVVIAPGCDGTDVGEAWSSFQWVRQLSKLYDITVLTYRKRNRSSLVGQLPDIEVIEWKDLPLVHRWERFNSGFKPGILTFNWKALRWLRKEIVQGRQIDLIHQITPIALRYPSVGYRLGLPYIIGPLAGSLSTPAKFEEEMSGETWYLRLRQSDAFRIKFDPFLRRTFERADVVIGVAPYVRDILGPLELKRFEVLCETAVTELPKLNATRENPDICRLLYVGRITRMKGVRDAIRALAQLTRSEQVTLDIVGDGDDRGPCEREAHKLGVDHKVVFHGKVPRADVDDFYRNADVFLFPSMREPSGNVVLEAMSFGLPLIVADRGGPGFVVDNSFGIRVPVTSPNEFAKRLGTAIITLVSDPALRKKMGDMARERVATEHVWGEKSKVMSRIYEDAIGDYE